MKRSPSFWSSACVLLCAFILWGCHPSPGTLTVVTGKTVFGDLAVEGARLEIDRWEQDRWQHHSASESGYHGSFRLHLPEGRYRMAARKTLRIASGEVVVSGALEDLVVAGPRGRMDQIVIEMGPERDPG